MMDAFSEAAPRSVPDLLGAWADRQEAAERKSYARLGARRLKPSRTDSAHGASEAMRLRARIAAFFCEALGFRVIAFESSLFLCHLANVEVDPTPQRMLTSSVIGVWHTREMMPLFERIARSRATRAPIQLAGFDIQPIGGRRKLRPAFFGDLVSGVEAEYGRQVQAFDTAFFAECTWTRRHFGRAVVTIGQYEIAGTAVNNARTPYEIPQPEAGSLEYRLRGLSSSPYFLDLRAAARTVGGAWLAAPVSARYNGQHSERLVPADQYDALVVLPTLTIPRFLY